MPKKELYKTAAEFFQTKLWERLYDSELFAVKMPDGEIGYVSVMGMLGEHLALAVYPGEAALGSYRALFEVDEAMREAERFERMMGQDCVMCSFEDRAELTPRDLREIRAHNLKFRGRRAYPLFQRFKPRCAPWHIEDEKDEERLRLGLLAGLEVARRLEGAPVQQDMFRAGEPGASQEALGFSSGAPYGREIPLLTPLGDGTFSWGRIKLPEPPAPEYPSPALEDELLLARLKKRKKSGAWECGTLLFPEPVAIGEEDASGSVPDPVEAPRFPLLLVVVNHADGMLLSFGTGDGAENSDQALVKAFAECMEHFGVPGEVFVRDRRSFSLLSRVAEQLSIRLLMEKALPFLDEAEDGLMRSAGADVEANSEDALDELMGSGLMEELPFALKRQLKKMLESGALPEATAAKARRLISGEDPRAASAPAAKDRRLVSGGEDPRVDPAPPAKQTAAPPAKQTAAPPSAGYVISASPERGRSRRIRVPEDATLLQLHRAILDAFGLEDDHAHAFFLDDRLWSGENCYFSQKVKDGARLTARRRLRDLGLIAGTKFKYLFDFGDERRFQLKVIETPDNGEKAPAARGAAGAQTKPEPPGKPSGGRTPKESEKPHLPEETALLLRAYFDAFSNLYGILPLRKALEIYNMQNPPISERDFAAFVKTVRREKHPYFILGEDEIHAGGKAPRSALDREIVEESLVVVDEGYYDEMKQGQEGKPYYIPGKRSLLQYADNHYFERSAECCALWDFLHQRMKLPGKKADSIIDELQLFARMAEKNMNYVLGDMERIGLKFAALEEVQSFLKLYADMSNNTRMPINRGHTPREMLRMSGPRESGAAKAIHPEDIDIAEIRNGFLRMDFPNADPKNGGMGEGNWTDRETGGDGELPSGANPAATPSRKIGRNDPCPCGSGKKYKRCCGKNS